MTGQIDGCSYDVIDPEFEALIIPHARIEQLWSGGRWLEGPAWFPAGRYAVFSDIPENRMMRWDETDGSVSEFRAPSNNSNGHTVDLQGRLVSCEHLSRRVTRTEHDGSITVIADRFQGKRFNSPNDVVVRSDGSVWFTDPDYGIMSDYEGQRADSDIGACHVYRVDPRSGDVKAVATDYIKPNGLAFSVDERHLYIADTGGSHIPGGPAHIRRHGIKEDSVSLDGGEVFADCTAGLFDGFRLDTQGRVWSSAGDGVHCISADGRLLGKIRIPEIVSNISFAGPKRNRILITATTSLYGVYVSANGV